MDRTPNTTQCRLGTVDDIDKIVEIVNAAYYKAEAQLLEGKRTDRNDILIINSLDCDH
jgi:hypothetical protein